MITEEEIDKQFIEKENKRINEEAKEIYELLSKKYNNHDLFKILTELLKIDFLAYMERETQRKIAWEEKNQQEPLNEK